MGKILTDFSGLSELKNELSLKDNCPIAEDQMPCLVQIKKKGNTSFEYNTYYEAAAAAVKSFPFISNTFDSEDVITSKKDCYIAIGSKGHRYYFRYKMRIFKKKFVSPDRVSAFRTILFFFNEVKMIDAAHIIILENTDNRIFVLSVNGVALASSKYKKFTGNYPMLKTMKEKMLDGSLQPVGSNDEGAIQIGSRFREQVQESSILDELSQQPVKDNTEFKHKEKIRVSTKEGFIDPEFKIKDFTTPTKKVYPGRSLPAKPMKERPPEPWIVNKWANRYDHDD